jgi:steroid delta-isomerase-like uncharacterized protein
MSLDSNKALVTRLFSDVLNRAAPSAINEIVAENYSEQEPFPGQTPGRAGVAERLAALFAVFPDVHYELQDLIAEDNKIVARWTMHGTQRAPFLGVPVTNQEITITGMDIYIIEDNQIVSHWDEVNFYSFLAQTNSLPKP